MNYISNLKRQIREFFKMLCYAFRIGKTAWGMIILSSVCGIIEVICSLGFVWAMKTVVDIATHVQNGNLLHWVLIIVGIIILQLFFGSVALWVDGTRPIYLSNRLRLNLFSGLLNSRWNEMEKFHSGDLLNRVMQDAGEMVKFLCGVIPFLIVTAFQLIASFLFFCTLDSSMAYILAVGVPVFILFSKVYVQKMRAFTKEIRAADSRIQSVIQESTQYRLVLKTFEKEPLVVGKLNQQQQEMTAKVKSKTRLSLFSNTVLSIGFNGGYLLVFIWGVFRLNTGAISFGTLTAFLQLVNRMQRPAYDLSKIIPSFISAWTAADRLQEIERIPAEQKLKPVLLQGSLGLRLENLSFSYSKESRKVIDSMNFDFRPGTINAIIGETGAGKTTLLRLILALITPDSGSLSVYSDKEKIGVSTATRRNFVYVPQGNTLFSGTIRDNLLMGNPSADEEQLKKVLEVSAAQFVFDLENGLDTVLSERGVGLSEGQAQRIAIARSLLRPGNILLFDEATSALDVDTETKVLANLQREYSDRTMIFITHHPSLAEICDSVLKV